MSVIDETLNKLEFSSNETNLYKKIMKEIFLKDGNSDKKSLLPKILKMIDQEYSE